jgi:hypothetical protein
MLFNSPGYIFFFLPIVLVVYFWLNHQQIAYLVDSYRAESIQEAMTLLRGMIGMNGIVVPEQVLKAWNGFHSSQILRSSATTDALLMPLDLLYYLIPFAVIAFLMPNALQVSGYIPYRGRWSFKRGPVAALFIAYVLFYSLIVGIRNEPSVFLYFNF